MAIWTLAMGNWCQPPTLTAPAATKGSTNVATALSAVEDWPATTTAVGVTTAARTVAIHGPIDHPFALASVTKPLAAWAVLVAVSRGALSLDEPIASRAIGPDVTIAHLLAHASGLGPDASSPVSGVGRRRIYSNHGFEVLGELTAAAVGQPFEAWLEVAVLTPLAMTTTRLEGSPAHAATSTVRDLLAFARELLRPTLLSVELHARASSPAFAELAGVLPGYGRQDPNPWGLGVEIRGDKQPHWTGASHSRATFGHFGQSGTFLWVDPSVQRAAVCLTDLAFGAWAVAAWPAFNDMVRATYA